MFAMDTRLEKTDVLVEIRIERPLSIAVLPGNLDLAAWSRHQLIWLPRDQILAIRREGRNRATLTLPRWLAEHERLISQTEDHSAQGSLL
jgi:hypothetical protein